MGNLPHIRIEGSDTRITAPPRIYVNDVEVEGVIGIKYTHSPMWVPVVEIAVAASKVDSDVRALTSNWSVDRVRRKWLKKRRYGNIVF